MCILEKRKKQLMISTVHKCGWLLWKAMMFPSLEAFRKELIAL